MEISKDKGTQPIDGWPQLTHAEMYSKSTGAPPVHIINDKLLDAATLVKQRFGELRITSTFRTQASNTAAGGATSSQHLLGNAFDHRPVDQDKFEIYHAQIAAKTGIYHELIDLGVRGFGVYDNFVHLDVRPTQNAVHWNDSGITLEKLIERALDPNTEDGTAMVVDYAKRKGKEQPLLLVALGIIVYLIFFGRD